MVLLRFVSFRRPPSALRLLLVSMGKCSAQERERCKDLLALQTKEIATLQAGNS